MDEASIVSALQEDLQNYKVKIQIRRKESQLHVLITRFEGDDVDYASLYSIVKRRIDKLVIEDASSLIVYGRLSGEKHPEWQKISELKPQLPLIELDLEEIDEFGDTSKPQAMEFPTSNNDIAVETDRLTSDRQDDEFNSFANSIENDLRLAAIKARTQSISQNNQVENQEDDSEHLFDLGGLDLAGVNLDNQPTERLEDLSLDAIAPPPPPLKVTGRSPASNRKQSEDFDFNENFEQNRQPLSKVPMPLPPPISVNRRSGITGDLPTSSNSLETEETLPSAYSANRGMLWSGAFVAGAIAILGLCGWLVWERSVQQRYLVDARSLANQNLNPQTIKDVDTLVTTRNQLQNVITQLEGIPNRPTSLYGDAQSEIEDLRPKLESFELKIGIEQDANKKIETAKNLTIAAATVVQNPPHRSTVWKDAQQKRQQALQILGEVPATSVLYADAQNRLKAYSDDLVQINRWVDIQQRAESVVSTINPNIVSQLKQLKISKPEKAAFLNQCRAIVQPQIANADAQRTGIGIGNLTSYLCAYFWDS